MPLPASNDMTAFGGSVEGESGPSGSPSRTGSRGDLMTSRTGSRGDLMTSRTGSRGDLASRSSRGGSLEAGSREGGRASVSLGKSTAPLGAGISLDEGASGDDEDLIGAEALARAAQLERRDARAAEHMAIVAKQVRS